MKCRRSNLFRLLAAVIVAGSIIAFISLCRRVSSQSLPEKRYKPELVVQVGHVGPILSIAYSPDGRLIATGSEDATVKLWSVESGRELRTLVGHIGPVNGVSFSPDGTMIASAGADFVTRIWDVKTGAMLKNVGGNWNADTCVAFRPDGRSIVIGSDDQTVKLIDLTGGTVEFSEGLERHYDPETAYKHEPIPLAVTSVAVNGDGSLIAAARNDKTISILSAVDGKKIKVLTGLSSPARDLSFTHNGESLLVADNDEVKILNFEDGSATTLDSHNSNETAKSTVAAGISIDAKIFATADANAVRIIDATTGKQQKTLAVTDKGVVGAIAFSPNSRSLAVSETIDKKDYLVRILNLDDDKKAQTLKGISNQLFTIAVSPDGKKIATAPDDGKIVKLWDLTGNSSVKSLATSSPGIPTLRFSPDSSELAIDSMPNLEIWNVETGSRVRQLDENSPELDRMPRFMPDGRQIVALKMGLGLEVYDIKSGAVVKRYHAADELSNISPPISFAIDKSGKTIALGESDGQVLLMDPKTGAVIDSGCSQKNGPLIDTLEFSNDARFLAISAKPGRAVVCDVVAHRPVWTKDGLDPNADMLHSYFSSFAFSPDSKTVAGICEDSWIKIMDTSTGKLIYDLPGHNRYRYLRNSVAFSPDGKILYVTDGGNRIRFWSMVNGTELASFVSSGDKDWAVVTPDGFFDASEGGQQLLHFIVAAETGYETISLDQLKWYYVPGLLKQIISGQSIKRPGDFSVTLFPTAEIRQTKVDSTAIDIDLQDRGGGIGRVEVRVNGSELLADARIGQKSYSGSRAAHLAVDIPRERLHVGANNIDVIAWNDEGNVRGRPQTLGLELSPDGVVTRGASYGDNTAKKKPSEINFYAIISGISDYAGDNLDLRYAAKDAEDITKAIAIASRKYFCAEEMAAKKPCARVHLRLLTTETDKNSQFPGLTDVPDLQRRDPVKSSYSDVFADVARRAGPDDVVLIYFSGHATSITSDDAVKDSGFADTYIYPTRDATSLDRTLMSNRVERERTTVSSLELARWLSNIKADKKVLILDTCAAGAAQNDLMAQTRAVDALQVRSIDRLQERTGLYVLMGSAADAVSFEANEFRQGLLTYSLLEGMTLGTTLREGGFLDVEKWFSFSEDKVEELAKGIGGMQRPSFFKSPQARSFDIGRIEGGELAQIPLARRVPLILQPELREDGKRTDRERLTEKLESSLIEQSVILTRGQSVAINYVNAANATNGLSPRGSYTVNGDIITIELSLIRDEEEVARIKVSGTRAEIVAKLVQELITAASAKK